MLPTQAVLQIIERLPPDQQDVALELHSLIVSAAPGATEQRRRAGFSDYFAERGGPVKYKRFARLPDYAHAPWDDPRALIAHAARFDPYTLSFR